MIATANQEQNEKKTRVPQAVRSALMKERLSKAAFDVIRQVGYDSFRTSAVSKEAGVSQGAQLHHFPTKDSLALAAMDYAYRSSMDKFRENFAIEASGEALIDLMLQDFKDFYLSDYFMVALDILLACSKNEELQSQLSEMASNNRITVERQWLERLVDDGWSLSDAEAVMGLSHSIIRGFYVRGLLKRSSSDNEKLLDRWKKMVKTLYLHK